MFKTIDLYISFMLIVSGGIQACQSSPSKNENSERAWVMALNPADPAKQHFPHLVFNDEIGTVPTSDIQRLSEVYQLPKSGEEIGITYPYYYCFVPKRHKISCERLVNGTDDVSLELWDQKGSKHIFFHGEKYYCDAVKTVWKKIVQDGKQLCTAASRYPDPSENSYLLFILRSEKGFASTLINNPNLPWPKTQNK